MFTTTFKCVVLAVCVAVCLQAIPSVGYADVVTGWPVINGPGTVTWTSTSGDDGNGLRTYTGGALTIGNTSDAITFNQTGGTLTFLNEEYGTSIGQYGPSVYNMSGDAKYVATGTVTPYAVLLANAGTAIWSLTDNASVSLDKYLRFSNAVANDAKVYLAGSASFATSDLTYCSGTNEYISFAGGSLASLTVSGKVKADYEAWVSAGVIRVNDATVSNFDGTFKVTGNTLTLQVPEPGTTLLMSMAALSGLLCYAWRRRKCVPSQS